MKRIVCIDDDGTILDVNKALLEETGNYQVICFTSGSDALREIPSLQPDLILLDMVMPVMDGIAVLKLIRSDPAMRKIPIIFMTAKKDAEDVKKYMDMGAVSVITKPIDMDDFPHQMEMLSNLLTQ